MFTSPTRTERSQTVTTVAKESYARELLVRPLPRHRLSDQVTKEVKNMAVTEIIS